jgi:hypothetical protein
VWAERSPVQPARRWAAVSLFKTKKLGRHAAGADQRQIADTAAGAEE